MDFALSDDLAELKARTERFVREQILPYEQDARQTAHGPAEELRRELVALGRRAGLLSPLVTKSLVICGEAGFNTQAGGKQGALLRAYDKATGEDRGAVYMPAPQTGSPMTYMLNGRQHILLAIGGGQYSSELIAYRLKKA